jgi:anti-anti-sigma regulatory factor
MPVVVDLSNLAFIDSSGLHVLLSAAPAAIVCASSSNVGRVLGIIQADEAVPVYEDASSAIQAATR